MAVAFDKATNGLTSVSVASWTWTHTPVGTPRSVVVFVITYANSGVDNGSSVTYAGTTVPAVTGGFAADTATEPGCVKAYFLDNIAAGAQSVVVSRTNNAVVMWAQSLTFTAALPTEVFGIVLVNNDAAYAEQSVTDGSPGSNSVRVAAGYYGGATPQPVGANTTIATVVDDQTAFGANVGRETTAGQGARLVGFTQATSDDQASVHFAVREAPLIVPPRQLFQAVKTASLW